MQADRIDADMTRLMTQKGAASIASIPPLKGEMECRKESASISAAYAAHIDAPLWPQAPRFPSKISMGPA